MSPKNLVLLQILRESHRCHLVLHPSLQRIITCLALPDVEAFVRAMFASEGKQLDAMVNYIRGNHLDVALRRQDWTSFAIGYNGPAGAGVYDIKIANAYNQLAVA